MNNSTYMNEEEFDLYKLGSLVACVVFSGVNIMLIAAVIGLFIKVQSLQKRIDLFLTPTTTNLNNSGSSLRYQLNPGITDFSGKETPSSIRHTDQMNDLYY
ncbi:hypothetical protein FQR65_LT05564 [Abscondita terminalis]|nr:hypothetical protein FQR65_LT05564 [Abscondita terminalis]